MKIALIQPAKPDDKSTAAQHWSLCRPLSLLYLFGAIQKTKSHSAEIFDLELIFASMKSTSINEVISSLDHDVFGVTATTFTRHEAVAVIRIIREYHPGKKIIVGGVHFMHCDIDTLMHIPEVDIVVRGEGEKTIVAVLDALQGSSSLDGVKGITYRDCTGKIKKHPDSELFEDLDGLDVYKLKSPKHYPEYLLGSVERIPAVSIMSSRGCPYKCVFCAKSGTKYRHRSTQNVINEIKYYVEEFGITAFNFLDLTFTANPERSKELCQSIIDEKLNIQWWCETRANVPLDLITLMQQAGCKSLVVGVETGSASVLERIQKGVSLAQIERLLTHVKELGIETTAYFMCSHVSETYDEAMETIKFIRRIEGAYKINTAMQPCMILPGTEIECIARERGLLPAEFSWASDYSEPLNAKVGQVTTIPLFLDVLSHEQIYDILSKEERIKTIRSRYNELSFSEFKKALNSHGFYKLIKILILDFFMSIRLSK